MPRSRRPPGPAAKSGIFRELLARADPLTAKYLVKVLSGELRIGLREGLVEAAIAKAFDRPLDAVKWAGMLTGDIGRMAELARDDRLADASLALFHPIKFMLASPAEDAAEIVKRLGVPVWVEDKYDGIRAQLHRHGDDVRLYSRDLHEIGNQFPEIVEGARDLGWDGILDGEILAWRDGTVLPFIALQARLGRKSPSAAIRAEVPVIFVAFDVLGLGPERSDGRGNGSPTAGHGRGDAARAARGPATAARDPPAAAGRRGRGLRPQPPRQRDLGRRAGGRVPERPGTAERGPDGQGPRGRSTRRVAAASAG